MARIILTIFPLTADVIYEKVCGVLNTKEYSLLIDTTFKHNDLPNVNPKCIVPENIHSTLPSPPRRALKLVLPPPRWNFLSRGACHPPPPPTNLVRYPLERIFVSKMVLHYIIIRKIIFFCDRIWKNLFIYVGRVHVSHKLKDVIS